MRHVRSILYAIVLAPAVWVLCGVGFTQDLTGRARDGGGVESITGLLLLLLAGATYAILVFAPISPAGPLLSGLVFFGISVFALASPSSYADLWAPGVSKEGFDLSRPGYGLATLLAVPLVCTALSARRWERYEPPQIPLFGTLGPARGSARPAGMPAAVLETAVIATPAGADTTAVVVPADETAVMSLPGAEPPNVGVASSDEAPTAAVPTSGEPATEAVASSDEAQTEAVATSDEAQPDADNRPAQAGAEEHAAEPTATFAVSSSGEITATNTTPDDATEPTAVAAAGEEPTEASTAATTPVDEKTGDQTTEAAPAQVHLDHATAAEAASGEAEDDETTPVAAGPATQDETTDGVPAPAPMDEPAEAAPAATASAASRNDTAAASPAGPADDEDEKTQVIKLPVAGLTTRDLRRHPGEKPTHNIDHGGKTQVIGPGERTQVIPLLHGDETQVIKLPGQRMPPADGEKTQVIRLGTGTVEPPADRTQVLTFPAKNPPGEGATERREPAKPPSIVGEERPNPGDDPTTRIVPPDRSAKPGQDSGEETTVDVARGKRIMTVTNLERPADEVADDTRRLVPPPPPTQRRPEDETT